MVPLPNHHAPALTGPAPLLRRLANEESWTVSELEASIEEGAYQSDNQRPLAVDAGEDSNAIVPLRHPTASGRRAVADPGRRAWRAGGSELILRAIALPRAYSKTMI